MILNLVFLLVGFCLVIWGADKFTDGACGLARRWRVSELVIGLTVVSIGTSLPELIVSLLSSIQDSGDMSIGNIMGSNIFNTMVIVGCSAMVMRISVSPVVMKRDMVLSLSLSGLLWLVAIQGRITRMGGACLFALFCLYLLMLAYNERKKRQPQAVGQSAQMDYWRICLYILIGMGCLVGGGNLLVNSGTELARMWGMSERVIGLTILACGTSLPELATSVVAARKGRAELALGNVLGSNIFNITFVLGLCNLMSPTQIPNIALLDWVVLLGSGVLLLLFAVTGRKINRLEGFLLLALYVAYLSKLVMQ